MRRKSWCTAVAAILAISCSGPREETLGLRGPYLGQSPPGRSPKVFAPELVSTSFGERDASWSPDGSIFVWTIWSGSFGSLVLSELDPSGWTIPRIAPFSGRYSDLEPTFTPDGSRLFFVSNRPLTGEGEPKDYDIWLVDRNEQGWGTPVNIGPPVNTKGNEFYPSITANGTIYFTAERPGSFGGEDIYRSVYHGDDYGEPENIGVSINSARGEFNACVAPDESLLLFSSFGRADGHGGGDLYVSFRNDDGNWDVAKNLGPKINTTALEYCPSISPDGRFFFFSSRTTGPTPYWNTARTLSGLRDYLNGPLNGNGDIFWVEMSLIHDLR